MLKKTDNIGSFPVFLAAARFVPWTRLPPTCAFRRFNRPAVPNLRDDPRLHGDSCGWISTRMGSECARLPARRLLPASGGPLHHMRRSMGGATRLMRWAFPATEPAHRPGVHHRCRLRPGKDHLADPDGVRKTRMHRPETNSSSATGPGFSFMSFRLYATSSLVPSLSKSCRFRSAYGSCPLSRSPGSSCSSSTSPDPTGQTCWQIRQAALAELSPDHHIA